MSMAFRRPKNSAIAAVLLGGLCLAPYSTAATPALRLGSIAGSVKDVAGVPQMGATIDLFNKVDKLIDTARSDERGTFAFASLLPDLYSIRISVPSFVPAFRRNIAIKPGMESILAINLASVFSSIELVSTVPSRGALMSDDWIWVLRSSMTTRPALRLLDPALSEQDPHASKHSALAFSDTRGLVKISSGETNPYGSVGSQPDLGTSFALATWLNGSSRLQFTGNVGYVANMEAPATGFRTSFSRNGDSVGPEVKLTMQQYSLARGSGPQDNAVALRRMSLTMIDRMEIMDGLKLEYGSSMDSISFLDRLNYISPFARLSYTMGGAGVLAIGYSNGAPPMELLASNNREEDASLQQDLAALSLFPRVSLRDGHTQVQRTQNIEIGYHVTKGSRTYSVGAYREQVTNGALTMSTPSELYNSRDLLPELQSNSSVFNIGTYSRQGYSGSVKQAFGEEYSVVLSYGYGGVLRTDGRELLTNDPGELRSMIRPAQQQWASVRVNGIVPWTSTKMSASYEWMDYRSLLPGHVSITQQNYPEAGLNFRVKQPLPCFGVFPGHMEASAELRNMLAQGYLPITPVGGQQLLLTNYARTVRGGVSFTF